MATASLNCHQIEEKPRRDRSPSVFTTIESRIYRVDLHIQQGKDLAIKDLNGTSDPYVKVFYRSTEKYTTNIVYKSLNPIWDEKCSFFVDDLTKPISFDLFDYDRIGRDEPMGSTKLDLEQIPLDTNYSIILELNNEKRSDGKIGSIQISLMISEKASDGRDEVGREASQSLWLIFIFKILRTLSKPLNVKSSLISRSTGTTTTTGTTASGSNAMFHRRTIDIFIIEGRLTNGGNKTFSPYVRLKFGTQKKCRTQVGRRSIIDDNDQLSRDFRRLNRAINRNGINHLSTIFI